ncbi:TIGR03618 family F420-dependent PPOX class oxidoreductase [Kineococcus sp. SYSU DK004]|uniref:TIGR03618 family F420-dependent PPOX class oxidoreductase n=1 Tax=Kineococcus sp. SYSU DK004 TaxID=3383125 RepID=UPI003D7D5233
MPVPPLPDDVTTLLRRPNPAVMATVHPDGHPVTVATWYLLQDDGRVLLNLDASRARLRHLERDPRVSLTALAEDDWHTHVSLQGRVVQVREDTGLADIDRLSGHYLGTPYPHRDSPRVSVLVEVERWHGWGAARREGTAG